MDTRPSVCPLWVKSRHVRRKKRCALYPNSDRESEIPQKAMSALVPGHVHCTSACLLWAKSGHCVGTRLVAATKRHNGGTTMVSGNLITEEYHFHVTPRAL